MMLMFLLHTARPYGVLDDVKPFSQYQDDHAGCAALLDKIKEVKPKVHAFGHIHQHYGTKRLANSVFIETLFINASTCNSRYVPVNPPIVVDTETWSLDESNI
jgi:Icc-related predicted phosphoesterase